MTRSLKTLDWIAEPKSKAQSEVQAQGKGVTAAGHSPGVSQYHGKSDTRLPISLH
jgi:hypothetical protein